MNYPNVRMRRLRQSEAIRKMVRETTLSPDDFILPLFVLPGKNLRKEIRSMPGQFQLSLDQLVKEVKEAKKLGIPAVILFGIPEKKDAQASEAYAKDGIIQRAVKEIKNKVPEMAVITDLCFCEYTSHGHCGVIKQRAKSREASDLRPHHLPLTKGKKKRGLTPHSMLYAQSWSLDNDATLELIAKTAISQAEAGADIIAPSGMIDGMVKTIREALDQNGFEDKMILSYSAKYASAFYGPFREAAESLPQFGDRKTYQMDPANAREALREVAQDLEEGADMVMVKPALAYLDIVSRVKKKFNVPVAAYNVSGEYAMVKAAAKNSWIDEQKIILEILTSIKRAGADFILTYHAKEAIRFLH